MTFAAAIHWSQRSFAELDAPTLYELLRLRALVFVVEQDCPYLDLDGRDSEASHLIGQISGQLVAYARWFANNQETALGRIVTHPKHRGQGLGRTLMMEVMSRLPPNRPIVMHAQDHLRKFYGAFGFKAEGQIFLEDGIPHVRMCKRLP